jgi:hypothetical protein
MNPVGDGLMVPAAHHELREREGAYLNVSPENCATSGAFLAPPPRPSPRKVLPLRLFSASARVDSAALGRGSLAQKRSASQHARPARRTVPNCTRRAGLLANRNVALGLLAPAAQTHVPRSVAASFRLEAPHRRFPALRIEMAFRTADRLSRETSKTGLWPVGLVVELLPTGLRPVASSANTRNSDGQSVLLAIDYHRPSCLGMLTLRRRIVGAPTLCDARPLPPWLTASMAHADTAPPSSISHTHFSALLARASRRPWLLRTDKNSLALRIVDLPRPSTLVARLRCPHRRWLTRKPRAGPHARPARRPVSSCRRRTGLLPTRTARSLQLLPQSDPAFRAGQARRPARPSDHQTTEKHAWGNNARRRGTGLRGTPSSPPFLSLPWILDENLRNPPTSRCTRPRFARRVNGRALGGQPCCTQPCPASRGSTNRARADLPPVSSIVDTFRRRKKKCMRPLTLPNRSSLRGKPETYGRNSRRQSVRVESGIHDRPLACPSHNG